MKKLTKLQRSQNAHWKLRTKYANVPGRIGDVKYFYHDHVVRVQKAEKRVLSKSERKEIFKKVSDRIH